MGGTGANGTSTVEELSLDELAKQLDDYSDRISTQVRTVNLGVLGLTWLLLLPSSDVHAAFTVPRRALLAVTLCCILAILAEFGQYLLGERTVDETFNRAEKSSTKSAAYDAATLSYRGQLVCYRAKLLLTFAAAGILLLVVGNALLS